MRQIVVDPPMSETTLVTLVEQLNGVTAFRLLSTPTNFGDLLRLRCTCRALDREFSRLSVEQLRRELFARGEALQRFSDMFMPGDVTSIVYHHCRLDAVLRGSFVHIHWCEHALGRGRSHVICSLRQLIQTGRMVMPYCCYMNCRARAHLVVCGQRGDWFSLDGGSRALAVAINPRGKDVHFVSSDVSSPDGLFARLLYMLANECMQRITGEGLLATHYLCDMMFDDADTTSRKRARGVD